MKPLNTIYLELTNNCNCACKTCPQTLYKKEGKEKLRPKGFMDEKNFYSWATQAYDLTWTINISYFGEHTLHPKFVDFMDFFSKRPKDINVCLYTNFLNITKQHMDAVIHARITNLLLSVDAATSETYENLRCGKTCTDLDGKIWTDHRYERVVEKLEYWFKRSDHVPTRFECPISHYNINDIKSFVQKWIPFLACKDEIFTKVVLTYGGAMLDEPFIKKNPCTVWDIEKIFVITWDGKVGPCYLDTNMDLGFADANTQTLKQIYDRTFTSYYDNIRDGSKERRINPCKSCIDASNRCMDKIFNSSSNWTTECDNYLSRF